MFDSESSGKTSRTDQLWCLLTSLIVFQPCKEPVNQNAFLMEQKNVIKKEKPDVTSWSWFFIGAPGGELN